MSRDRLKLQEKHVDALQNKEANPIKIAQYTSDSGTYRSVIILHTLKATPGDDE